MFEAGQLVEVNFGKDNWLPGKFSEYSLPLRGESFERCQVEMDNGTPCNFAGFHPDCVRAAS